MSISFIKMHSCGNDFIILPIDNHHYIDYAHIAHRHYGLGCDQILTITPDFKKGHAKVTIYNQDGSKAKACGNGTRCLIAWLDRNSPVVHRQWQFFIEDRIILGWKTKNNQFCVVQGPVRFIKEHANWVYLEVGNRHIILSSPFLSTKQKETMAQHLSQKYDANVTLIHHNTAHNLRVQTWERGVGWTLSCGSAACAVSYAMSKTFTKVQSPGGTLTVYQKNQHWYHYGPVTWVAQGILY